MFNRQNIVDEHDLREAVTRTAHYIDSLPSTPNVCACTQAEPGLQPKNRRLGLEPLYFPEDPPTLEG